MRIASAGVPRVLAACAAVALAALSYIAVARTIIIPIDNIRIPIKRLTVSGHVRLAPGSFPYAASMSMQMTAAGQATRTAPAVPGYEYLFHFARFAQDAVYRVQPVLPTGAVSCSVLDPVAGYRDLSVGPGTILDPPAQDFTINCTGPAPTIGPALNTAVGVVPGGTATISAMLGYNAGASMTVRFTDCNGTTIGTATSTGGVVSVNVSPTTAGINRYCAFATLDATGQASAQVEIGKVAVLTRPNVTATLDYNKPTATVGTIAASFAVSDSGAATYSVPIAIPPGPAGMQPSIALSYSSQAGTGSAGFGWSISGVSTVTRCPATIASNGDKNGINYDNDATNDNYCLDGQRLIPLTGTRVLTNANSCPTYRTEYRTELESYSQVFAYEDECVVVGPSRFEVRTKSGQWLIYGISKHDPGALSFGDGYNGIWIMSLGFTFNGPTNSTDYANTVKAWPITHAVDRAGNLMKFEYCGDASTLYPYSEPTYTPQMIPCTLDPAPITGPVAANGFSGLPPSSYPSTEVHIKRITYGVHAVRQTDSQWSVDANTPATVDFVYQPRPASDQLRVFDSGGGESNLTYQLKSVVANSGANWANRYWLTYETAPTTGRTRLSSVQQCSIVGAVCLPATTFSYSSGTDTGPTSTFGISKITSDSSDVNIAGDFDGDGKTDMFYIANGSSSAKVALGADGFAFWREIPLYLNGGLYAPGNGAKFVADINGDGKAEFLFQSSGNAIVICDLHIGNGAYGPGTCVDTHISNPAYFLGDFNGDGRTDILAYESQFGFTLYPGTVGAGVGPGQAITLTGLNASSGLTPVASRFAVGDFNGDGRTDLAYRQNISTSYGTYCDHTQDPSCTYDIDAVGINICMSRPNPDHSVALVCGPEAMGPNGLLSNSIAMDFNGDGIADFAFPSDPVNKTSLWNFCLSSGNGNFQRVATGAPVSNHVYQMNSLCKSITLDGITGGVDDLVFGDFDGDGRTDLAKFISGGKWRICFARNSSTSTSENNLVFTCEDRDNGFTANGKVKDSVLSGDFDGDGKTDLVGFGASASDSQHLWMATSLRGIPDQLTTIRNGFGVQTNVAYLPLTDSAAYARAEANALPGKELVIQSPLYVVTETQAGDGTGTNSDPPGTTPGSDGTFDTTYFYEGLKGSTEGRGLLGFLRRTVTDGNKLTKITTYNQDSQAWFFAGRPQRIQTKASAANANRVIGDSLFEYQLAGGSPAGVYSPQVLRTTERKVDLNGAVVGCSRVANVDGNGALAIDTYGNLLATRTQNASDCNLDNGAFVADGIVKAAANTYETVDVANWIIGRLKTATVTHSGINYATIVRKSAFTYNLPGSDSCSAPLGHMCSETVEPDAVYSPYAVDREQYLKTLYAYDARGNVEYTTKRFLTADADRMTHTIYESTGRFVGAVIDPAGHREVRYYDDRFGIVTATRKYLDPGEQHYLAIDTPVDHFGRSIGSKTTADDGSVVAVTDVTWEPASYWLAPYAVYKVTTTSHLGAKTIDYFDRLQRKSVTETLAFNGAYPRHTWSYNRLGQLTTTNEPPSTNSPDATVMHSVAFRDDLGRAVVTNDNAAFGDATGYASTYNVFSGLYTASIRSSELAITKRDIEGRVEWVINCLGQVDVNAVAAGQDGSISCPTGSPKKTSYSYDAVGNVLAVTTPDGLVRSASYDPRGRKLSSTDPDAGTASYEYNGANELVAETHYQQQGVPISTSVTYDVLGRKKTQSGPGNFSASWTYDSCGLNGALCTSCSVDGGQVVKRDSLFDVYGRAIGSTLGIGGGSCAAPQISDSLTTFTLPDSQGRVGQVVHPSGVGFTYAYDSADGELKSIADSQTGASHWVASERYPSGRLKSASLGGSAASLSYTYYGFGVAKNITATSGSSVVQNSNYAWSDDNRYLNSRTDTVLGVSDSFGYDTLARLTALNGSPIGYDDGGSIVSRGGQTYTLQGGTTKVSNRLQSVPGKSFTYDQSGNLQSDGDHTVTWKGFNMPASISTASTGMVVSWLYDANYARVTETSLQATGVTTYYPGAERIVKDGVTRWRHYISTPEGTVGAVDLVGTTVTNKYWLRDHLGSMVREIIPSAGSSEIFGYDAWGKRTNVVAVNPSRTQEGFTGHEMLDEAGLVHMNGRIYDPTLGRFLSADPLVQAPFDGQSYNRYSYVLNNPLSATDPSGFSSRWVQVRGTVGAIAAAILINWGLPAIAQEGVYEYVTAEVASTINTVNAIAPVAAGFAAGGVAGGNIESALQGALFAYLNVAIGDAFPAGSFGNIAAHAVVGCAQAATAGGSCKGGAASGGFSALAAAIPAVNDAGLVGRVAVGAIASKIGGGDATNGAFIAAFDYLFNTCIHSNCPSNLEQTLYDHFPGYKAGNLINNLLLEGNGEWTGWEALDLASSALPLVGKGLSAGLNAGTRSVFFAGDGAKAEAATLGTRISDTPIGRFLDSFGDRVPRGVWIEASKIYASNARGVAPVVINYESPISIYFRYERGILTRQGVLLMEMK